MGLAEVRDVMGRQKLVWRTDRHGGANGKLAHRMERTLLNLKPTWAFPAAGQTHQRKFVSGHRFGHTERIGNATEVS
jgi:hypothetical protein